MGSIFPHTSPTTEKSMDEIQVSKDQETPPKEEKLSLPDYMLNEAEKSYKAFREDRVKIQNIVEAIKKQIKQFENELNSQEKRLGKLEGALAYAHSLVTKYRTAFADDKQRRKNNRRRSRQNGTDKT